MTVEQPLPHPHLSRAMLQQRTRLEHILARHVREEDAYLTDKAFIKVVWDRMQKAWEIPLLDPNE